MRQDVLLGIICSILATAASLPRIIIDFKKGEQIKKFNEWILIIGIWHLIFWLAQLFIH